MNSPRRYPLPTRKFPPRWTVPPPRVRRRWWDSRAVIGFIILLTVIGGAVFAHALTPYGPQEVDPENQFVMPNRQHPLGTDLFGRDVFTRVLHGGRTTLFTGVVAVIVASVPGTILGLFAGYFSKRLDALIMRSMDVMLSFPGILLALAIVAALGPGLFNVVLAVGIAGIPNYTRVVRASVLIARKTLYVRAAHSVGARHLRIIFRHILPNIFGSILALATVDVAWAILNASALSFLGLGVQPPTAEWGAMLNEGRGHLYAAPWVSIGPGAVLMLTILAINLLGDSLRDSLDPRLQTHLGR